MSFVERGRGNNKRILYLVKWLDYPERKDWTEEPFNNFSVGSQEKLWEFHQRNPDAPRDYRHAEGYIRKKNQTFFFLFLSETSRKVVESGCLRLKKSNIPYYLT